MTASATDSSARSKSPRSRTSVAVSRPASSRNTRSSSDRVFRAFEGSALDDRTYLDLAVRDREAAGQLEGGVEVGDLDDGVASDRFLGF